MKTKKVLFFILGCLSLVLAYIGIVLPGFPGTPFILLTAFFFIRSSDKMYAWILRRKLFAKIIYKFEENPTLPVKLKLLLLLPFWISIVVALVFFIEDWMFRGILLGVAIALSIVLFLIKTIKLRD